MRDAILTASPEQLQLMLYDGAIRFASQARQCIEAGEIEETHNLLTRAQRIVNEMMSGLRPEVAPELCERMSGLYVFVFNKLVDANVRKDIDALDAALDILKRQRETWALLLDKVQQTRADQGAEAQSKPESEGSLSIQG
jgi:flagellar protein FliS